MKCRNCKAVLEDGAKVCPSCGASVKQDMVKEERPKKKGLPVWAWAVIITVSVLALLVGSVAIWWAVADVESFGEGWELLMNKFDPPENDEFYKDSYTVSAKKAAKWREKVVAQVGDEKLTNGELQAYYWMNVYDFLNNYGYYAVYAGLDYTKPLDEQKCVDSDGTWQQFFLEDALSGWHKYQAMALLAQKDGMELEEQMRSDLENMRSNLAQKAVQGGFSSIDAMLQTDMGPGIAYDDYYSYTQVYFMGYMYFEKKYEEAKGAIDQEMLEEYFNENQEKLKESGITKDSGLLYDVRHILIAPEGGTKDAAGKTVYTEQEWEACRVKAQALLDEWLAGDATEESFAKFANTHSVDEGSKNNGGLYEGLDKDTDFVKEYKQWYLDVSRKPGDYGLVKSEYGYHIMYFSGAEEEWIAASRDGLLTQAANLIAAQAMDAYPIRVDYSKIVIGAVDLAANQSKAQ